MACTVDLQTAVQRIALHNKGQLTSISCNQLNQSIKLFSNIKQQSFYLRERHRILVLVEFLAICFSALRIV